jgi:hypothetical protein
MTFIKNVIKITKVVSLVFILILFTCLLHKPKTIKNNNNLNNNNLNSRSNLQKLIDQANHIFIVENFQSSPNEAVSNLANGIGKSNTQTTTTVMPNPPSPTDSCDSSNIETVLTDLDTLEKRCQTYEQNQSNKFDTERKRLDDIHRGQLDIEKDKINQLQEIVKYYKKEYDTKLTINTKCRHEKQLKLDNDIKHINKPNDNLKNKEIILELKEN